LPSAAVFALPQVGRPRRSCVGKHGLDRTHDRRAGLFMARCSSMSAPDQIWPMGLAIPLPAMSGAEPCTGSNVDG
jgi:hypothetical protein